MKLFAAAILSLLMLASIHASERTIKTRDGKTYTKAEITEIGPASVKISHDGGIITVPSENLPAEIQKEIAYQTLADRQMAAERGAEQKQVQDTADSQGRDEALKAAKEKKLKEAFYAIKSATQAEADAFSAMARDVLIEKLGEPVRTARTDLPGGGFTTLFYDERKPTLTAFVIRDGETVISGGTYKSVRIQRP